MLYIYFYLFIYLFIIYLHVDKIKNRRKQNFEDEANNMQLDKENTHRNWNRKYLSITFVLKYPDSFVCFYVFNKLTCKVRFDFAIRSPWSV